jgi:hypothetical protein
LERLHAGTPKQIPVFFDVALGFTRSAGRSRSTHSPLLSLLELIKQQPSQQKGKEMVDLIPAFNSDRYDNIGLREGVKGIK